MLHAKRVMQWVMDEVVDAEQSHRAFPTNNGDALALLVEEVGEIADVLNLARRAKNGEKVIRWEPEFLRRELVDAGAVVMMWLEKFASWEEEKERHAEAKEYYRGAGCAVGERSQGDGGSQLNPIETSGPSGENRGGECGTYGAVERDTTKNATTPDRVGAATDYIGSGRRYIRASDHFSKGSGIGQQFDRRRREGTAADRQPR